MELFIAVGIVLSAHIIGNHAYCTAGDIESCQRTSGLTGYLRSQGIDMNSKHAKESSFLLTLDETQLSQYCSMFEEYKSCIENSVLDYCRASERVVTEGAFDGIAFICKETFDEYISQHHSCMQRQAVRDDLLTCYKRALADMTDDTNIDQICRDSKKGDNCQINKVKVKCGEDTTRWYRDFLTKTETPVYEFLGCPETSPTRMPEELHVHSGEKSSEFDGVILFAVIGGVFGFAVIVCLASAIVACRRQCRKRRNASSLQRVDVGPGYTPHTDPNVVVHDTAKLCPK